jgi:hypothetical protein
MWQAVVERFEEHAPASVMARLALEQALPAGWVDEVFAANGQRQYPRELMFSTIVELMTLVSLGLRPSVHAAARKMGDLPVSLAALYDKLKRTEPAILRGLVCGSAQRLAPVATQIGGPTSLPGWQLRIVDGNHLPASQKRLEPLRGHRGAARCQDTAWWSRTPTWARCAISWPARTRTKASAWACSPWWPAPSPGSCGLPSGTSAPTPSCKASARRGLALSCASIPVTRA